VVTPLRFEFEFAEGQLTLRVPTLPGHRYRVEYADELPDGTWLTLDDEITGDGTIVTLTVSLDDAVPYRFYRITLLPGP
jgi:hypothetical protein